MSVRAARPDARPAHSTIIIDQRHKTRTIFAYLESEVGPDPHEPAAEVIRAARVLLVDHHGLEGSIRAARIARESGMPVVADVERNPGGPFDELLALVDHLVVSERFARQLTGADDPAEAAAELLCGDRQAVVVTCGAAGSWYVEKDRREPPHHCPGVCRRSRRHDRLRRRLSWGLLPGAGRRASFARTRPLRHGRRGPQGRTTRRSGRLPHAPRRRGVSGGSRQLRVRPGDCSQAVRGKHACNAGSAFQGRRDGL